MTSVYSVQYSKVYRLDYTRKSYKRKFLYSYIETGHINIILALNAFQFVDTTLLQLKLPICSENPFKFNQQ